MARGQGGAWETDYKAGGSWKSLSVLLLSRWEVGSWGRLHY